MAENSPIPASHGWFTGDDFGQPFHVLDEDDAVVDITGFTLEFTLRRKVGDANIVLQRTSADGITITDATAGELLVDVAAEDTEGLEPGNYVYALRRTDADSVKTLAVGPVVLQQSAAV